nr:glycosyltransferase [Capnocytophaga ochracea]
MENLREFLNYRKISKKFGRRKREILVKKGCKKGGVSL